MVVVVGRGVLMGLEGSLSVGRVGDVRSVLEREGEDILPHREYPCLILLCSLNLSCK